MTGNLSAKWDEISEDGYRAGLFRVHPDHLLDLFIGYSPAGEREFTLRSSAVEIKDAELPSFENIEIFRRESEGANGLTLRLTDTALRDLFSVICVDLAEASSKAESAAGAIGIFVGRVARWAELMRRRRSRGLSFQERLGLLGELTMVRWIMDETRIGNGVVVRGWRGPDGDTEDVGLNGIRIEVKARLSTQIPSLKISSLHQLNGDGRELCVALHRFSASEKGLSLRELVSDIASRIGSRQDDLMEFQRKLYLIGYEPEAGYVDESFHLDSVRVYRVTEDFPRLVPSNVPVGIREAIYTVACEAISGFLIEQEELGALIGG